MTHIKRFVMAFLVLVLLFGATNFAVPPAQASACTLYHTVRAGQTLSWIGRYYGVSWVYLAQLNGIKNPRWIYPGQVLCISTSGTVVPPASTKWSFTVVGVQQDKTVTIRTANFPDNVKFEVSIGRLKSGAYEWAKVADLDSDKGGAFDESFNLPAQFTGVPQLIIRLTQVKKNISVDRWFNNIPGGSGTGGAGYGYYWGIPTIWIKSVVKDSKVTIVTHNFPANVQFDVLMGPYGTNGINGYKVASFNSGAGGTLEMTFDVPAQLSGSARIAIRTQNLAAGFYSFNWFYNNTTY